MADTAPTTPSAWTTNYNHYITLNQNLIQVQDRDPNKRDALERAIAEQEEILLETSAPDLAAFKRKLQILWGIELEQPDHDGDIKRGLISDLEALIEGGRP